MKAHKTNLEMRVYDYIKLMKLISHPEIDRKVCRVSVTYLIARPKNGPTKLRCHQCNETFNSVEQLKTHLENLEASLKVFCKRCKNFVRLEESLFHLDITYSCVLCKLILPKGDVLAHTCLHSNSSQVMATKMRKECGICERVFFSCEDIDGHIREKHASIGVRYCKCCKVCFGTANEFFEHLGKHSIVTPAIPKISNKIEIIHVPAVISKSRINNVPAASPKTKITVVPDIQKKKGRTKPHSRAGKKRNRRS
ncbi:hypothetical protein JTB14_006872 [Gonioctena quinquepunctata]|nr:hypothetical protein JTB14_006872 [Gonioctena quinquepunctata]